ncbi:hypothetical protein [Nevskia soli]|uniref:hypothetical protein n=1 Tax=Nevskia soli TaxID=418856 RepID=UPI0012FBD254|nr:hypothetical protein [Nevskia soli]
MFSRPTPAVRRADFNAIKQQNETRDFYGRNPAQLQRPALVAARCCAAPIDPAGKKSKLAID